MQLAAHKGQFPYDPNLGSRLYTMNQNDPKLQQKTVQAIDEALEILPQVKVNDVTFTKDAVVVWIQTAYGIDQIELAYERREQGGNI